MGLAGPKNRTKLSHDPNNTAWARNTESFGHKILASQGWTPGDTLGAKDAAHADHYTAGSNSHIRVLLKGDQLGLGAKLTGNNAETFGLSLFSGILGRLNGKSEVQLEKEQRAQKDVELALYQSRKLGYINFVSAGFLVGDRIDKAEIVKKEKLDEELKKAKAAGAKEVVVVKESNLTDAEVKGTKRKRTGVETAAVDSSDSSSSSSEEEDKVARKSKKVKKSKRENLDRDGDLSPTSKKKKTKSKKAEASEDSDAALSKTKSKKSKDKKDKKAKASDLSGSEGEDRAARKARKAERRAQKEERRKKKDAKRAAMAGSASVTPSSTAPGTPAEPASASATPQPFIGRHAVRQRYIAAKGRAHLDPQALKEIFMVKA